MSRGLRLLVMFWFLSLSVLYGQTDSSLVYIQVKLISSENSEAIPFATVLLNLQLVGITSDENGYFDISLQKNDSLFVSSIGYENLRLSVKDLNVDSSLNIIRLSPKVYMLNEIMITQYPSYERLVEIVINPILSTNEKSVFRAYSNLEKAGLRFIPHEMDRRLIIAHANSPITAIYNIFSRSVKNQKKYIEIRKDEKKDHRFEKKVSNETIKRITGLSDSTTIVRFIAYCNFSESFLNTASEYELFDQIRKNYEDFKQQDK